MNRNIHIDRSIQLDNIAYDFVGSCVHTGRNIVNGHFYTVVKAGTNIFQYDDGKVPRIQKLEDPSARMRSLARGYESANVLLYARRI